MPPGIPNKPKQWANQKMLRASNSIPIGCILGTKWGHVAVNFPHNILSFLSFAGVCKPRKSAGFIKYGVVFFLSKNCCDWNSPEFGKYGKFKRICVVSLRIRSILVLIFVYFLQLSPKYLHTNSTSHTWPFSAIAELIGMFYRRNLHAFFEANRSK